MMNVVKKNMYIAYLGAAICLQSTSLIAMMDDTDSNSPRHAMAQPASHSTVSNHAVVQLNPEIFNHYRYASVVFKKVSKWDPIELSLNGGMLWDIVKPGRFRSIDAACTNDPATPPVKGLFPEEIELKASKIYQVLLIPSEQGSNKLDMKIKEIVGGPAMVKINNSTFNYCPGFKHVAIGHNDGSEDILLSTDRLAALIACLLYTSPSPRDGLLSRMPSSA